jgi:hypothetical protein
MKTSGSVDIELHVFLTSALERSESSINDPATLALGKETLAPIGQEDGWSLEPVSTMWTNEKSLVPAMN